MTKLKLKRSKYNNKIIIFDNKKFHSLLERDCYAWLMRYKDLYQFELETQKQYPICEHNKRRKYIADFVLTKNNQKIVIDVKSKPTITNMFLLKKELLFHKYGIKVHVVFCIRDIYNLIKQEFNV